MKSRWNLFLPPVLWWSRAIFPARRPQCMAERGKAKLPARFPRHPVPRGFALLDPAALWSFRRVIQSKANLNYQSLLLFYLLRPFKGDRPKGRFVIHNNIVGVKARLHRRFLSRQLDAIFVALTLQLQNRTCKPGAIFSAICRRDIPGVSNMFETYAT